MMNTHVVPCPACQTPLNVPPSAVGKRARCPACGDRFIIPARTDLLDDTLAGWIEHDVDEMIEDRNRQDDQNQESQVRHAIPQPVQAEDEPDASAELDETILGIPVVQEPAPAVVERPAPRPKPKAAPKPDDDSKRDYPKNLRTNPKSPHLVVLKCGSSGVRFAFDAKWLADEGFRASMPMRCIYSGNADRSKLIARPMVFADRSRARKVDVAELCRHLDVRSLGDSSPRELMKMMSAIESMPSPFMYAAPYYISNRYAHKMMHCMTRDRVSGGITAEVIIPDAICALDWLARVNGVCGKEYEMLERDTSMLHGDTFRELSELCRTKIQSWCKLRPREVFQLYLNDADFGRRDEGLAGVIVTDQRIIYCKYHHRGQARLDNEEAVIQAKVDGRFAKLTLQVGDERARMVKLHEADIAKLQNALGKDAKLSVVVR